MVEAAGQLFHLFRDGLDYAFILRTGCGACYPRRYRPQILVPARGAFDTVSRSMSLYRAGLRLALFLPLGVAIRQQHSRRAVAGFADVSPVFTLPLRAEATILLIEPASENATQSGLHA